MGTSQSYGPADEAESIATLHRAIELGCNCFDTAENYGPFTNEQLLGRAFKGRTQGAGSSGVTAAGFKHDKIDYRG
jgi:aryl-alcohol dehydrogenase-like predicted oxidoreductase